MRSFTRAQMIIVIQWWADIVATNMLSTSAGDGLVLFKDYKFVLRKFVWIHGLFNQLFCV